VGPKTLVWYFYWLRENLKGIRIPALFKDLKISKINIYE